ncbi:MAG: flavodoxin, partial [Bacteroidales bacterium]|nr:flavodoxin [Bacteroidales bacterium]
MKKLLYLSLILGLILTLPACDKPEEQPETPNTEQTEEPKDPEQPEEPQNPEQPENPVQPEDPTEAPDTTQVTATKTLVVYYSFTNNVHTIVNELRTQIDADVLRIEPAEKGLDYAANNYAIGSALIAAIRNRPDDAASYPAIDPVEVDMEKYDTVMIATPLWWSQMAAPMQTFLFQYGAQMAGKSVALIVSSASSGISDVAADAKRLIPDGHFETPSL